MTEKQDTGLLAFLDDSGAIDQNSMIVGGIVAEPDAWLPLEEKWGRLLRRYGLPELHMAKVRNLTRAWRKSRYDHMLSDFTDAVLSMRGRIIGAGIELDDFKEATEKNGWICDPMCLCLEYAIQKCQLVADDWPAERYAILFDRLKKGSAGKVGSLVRAYRGMPGYQGRFVSWKTQSRLDCLVLQAADFAAYHLFKFLRNYLKTKSRIPDMVVNRLFAQAYRPRFPSFRYLDKDGLRTVADAKKRGERIESITLKS